MTTTLPNGFYTALGTPLDANGNILPESLATQIDMQCQAGAAGFLVLGSMGMQASVRQDQCAATVSAAANALNSMPANHEKRPILLAGVMDNSVTRVLDRIMMLSGLSVDGVVATTPFYSLCGEDALERFFTQIADRSVFPLYLYDLPSVTKIKITLSLVRKLAKHPNICGIKTGDPVLTRSLWLDESLKNTFSVIFSGLDVFDVASAFGISRFLDGMFACCPQTSKRMFELFAEGRFNEGGKFLNQILGLRDTMFGYNIFPAFAIAMNLLGCPGNHAPDYETPSPPEAMEAIRRKLIEMKELEN